MKSIIGHQLLLPIGVSVCGALIASLVLDPRAAISLGCGAFLLYNIFASRHAVLQKLLIAIFFALFITVNHAYVYSGMNVLWASINLFPLIAWSGALCSSERFASGCLLHIDSFPPSLVTGSS